MTEATSAYLNRPLRTFAQAERDRLQASTTQRRGTPMMLPDSLTTQLREIAAELTGAITDQEATEAVRAFLATCATFGVYVTDDSQELIVPTER